MTGTGNLDEDVSGANFDLEMNTLAGKVSCKGDASQSKTCHLPLGVGSLTFNAMSFPIKKGSTTVSVDLSLSAMLPGALAHTETKVTATATGGDMLFCMDIKSAPAVNEAPMVTATNASILEGVDCSKAACQKDCGCAMDKCAASIQTCLADKTCAKGQDCVMNCACGDKHCAMKCARAHPSRKGMAVAMCLANNCESDMGTAAMDEFIAEPQASASQLKLTWNDCGDSSTHTKITGFSPSAITTGQTATMAGTGNLDEDVSGANFDLEMNTLAGAISCKGDASESKTCNLPLGTGSLTFDAMTFPIKKGSTSVSVDLSLSAMLPGALAHTETKVTATATDGDKLFCMDIKSAPAEDEFVDLSPLDIKSASEVDVDLPVKWTFPEKPCADLCKLIVERPSPTGAKYDCECHNITTPDGFVLQTARIPSQKTFNNTKLPVFLMHGFITSAIDWVSQPYTTDNLPYMLSDAGYDVWLGNNRGNVFSVHNERLDMNSVEFWDQIDFDQMAELDVPAILEYVL